MSSQWIAVVIVVSVSIIGSVIRYLITRRRKPP
jgi:hypothetical protein